MMKRILFCAFLLCNALRVLACEVCERNQPNLLRGITHGAGPDSKWDYVIVCIALIIVAVTLFYSVKWLLQPGEKANTHIKRFILSNE